MSSRKIVFTSLLTAAAAAAIALGGNRTGDAEAPKSATEISAEVISALHMRIKIGEKTFRATLEDNATAQAFKAQLPLTVRMTELNGNEKSTNEGINYESNHSLRPARRAF
jgi:hypothetical protein